MAIWRGADTPVVEVPGADDEGNTMPVWYEGNRLPNIFIDDNTVPGKKDLTTIIIMKVTNLQ